MPRCAASTHLPGKLLVSLHVLVDDEMVKENTVYSSVECHYSTAAAAAVSWSSLAAIPLLLPDKAAASDGTVEGQLELYLTNRSTVDEEMPAEAFCTGSISYCFTVERAHAGNARRHVDKSIHAHLLRHALPKID